MVATDTLKSRDIRFAVTKLRANSVVPRRGPLYGVTVHPEVAVDLRTETGNASWILPHQYAAPQ